METEPVEGADGPSSSLPSVRSGALRPSREVPGVPEVFAFGLLFVDVLVDVLVLVDALAAGFADVLVVGFVLVVLRLAPADGVAVVEVGPAAVVAGPTAGLPAC